MTRYLITSEFYIYAESDTDAKSIVENLQEKSRKKFDNDFIVTEIHKAERGSIPQKIK